LINENPGHTGLMKLQAAQLAEEHAFRAADEQIVFQHVAHPGQSLTHCGLA
jgi:hypothetical protein